MWQADVRLGPQLVGVLKISRAGSREDSCTFHEHYGEEEPLRNHKEYRERRSPSLLTSDNRGMKERRKRPPGRAKQMENGGK